VSNSASPCYGPGDVVLDHLHAHRAVTWVDYAELATIRGALGKDRQRLGLPGSRVLERLSDDAVE
jgi:hypothetical protein